MKMFVNSKFYHEYFFQFYTQKKNKIPIIIIIKNLNMPVLFGFTAHQQNLGYMAPKDAYAICRMLIG
jgi:hypothetical protein